MTNLDITEINENTIEQLALQWFQNLGYSYLPPSSTSPSAPNPLRTSSQQTLLLPHLEQALYSLNPSLPSSTIQDALSCLQQSTSPHLPTANQKAYNLLKNGVYVQYSLPNTPQPQGSLAKLIDFSTPSNNTWHIANQLSVQGPSHTRRPDLVVYINGIPIAIIELKNPIKETTDVWQAYQQLETYKNDIPDLFTFNQILLISDNNETRFGSITANRERYMKWRTIDGKTTDPLGSHASLETAIKGLFDPTLLLDYLQNFILFEANNSTTKKIAGYHQFHACRQSHKQIQLASQPNADHKGGVVWHTQGAGKSIEMVCLTGKIMTDPLMQNPTVLIVTDRNDLDGQLFSTFSQAISILPEQPIQAKTRPELRKLLLDRPSGGIIFTTIQKFSPGEDEDTFPTLSTRSNVVVIVDEAHRTQYGFKGEVSPTGTRYGYAKHLRDALPNATFTAFTGTPLSTEDRDTQAVFGPYVHIYDMQQAIEDGATVPIYYEPRRINLELKSTDTYALDLNVDELTEDDDDETQEKTKNKWTALEKIAGADSRISKLTADLLNHFQTRLTTLNGKALVVAMSREICVKMYDEIIKTNPSWHSTDPLKGSIKIMMTGAASDPQPLQPHLYSDSTKKQIEQRFKNPNDPLNIVIVCDMWLTGFDVPCLHTLYLDKPLKNHTLMQAIARVNRVFHDKPGGLVVDYIGIGSALQHAINLYTSNHGRGHPAEPLEKALDLFKEHLDSARGILHGFDYSSFPSNAFNLLPSTADHVLSLPDGKKRFANCILSLTKAYSLCSTLSDASPYRSEIAFFDAVRSVLVKHNSADKRVHDANTDSALRHIISEVVKADDGVVNIFSSLGLPSPNISVLSPDFLDTVKSIPYKNLAVELLERLLRDQIRSHFATNVVQNRRFTDLLSETLRRYRARTIETAQVLDELLSLAKDYHQATDRQSTLGLSNDEIAFYDALATDEASLLSLGDETLKTIARELTSKLRASLTIDWQVRDSVRANIIIAIRNILRRHKYPKDKWSPVTDVVVQQAEALSNAWTAPLAHSYSY